MKTTATASRDNVHGEINRGYHRQAPRLSYIMLSRGLSLRKSLLSGYGWPDPHWTCRWGNLCIVGAIHRCSCSERRGCT